jgi:pseudaminic acid synthase
MKNLIKKKPTFIVAELSANHNNNFNLAVKTIEAMAKSGADAVKIQTYTANSLALEVDNKYFGPIKGGLWNGWKRYDLYKKAAMPWKWQPKLKKIAEKLGLIFFSSPFDFAAVDFLEKMNVSIYKVASPEITDIPLIKYIASKKKDIIISTGMADLEDIKLAITTCKKEKNNKLFILKCTSQYPASIEMANLKTIPDMQKKFKFPIGVSDHTIGNIVPMVAVSLGAKIVEKHFILDRKLGGLDSTFSMEPNEFKQMVDKIRLVEKTLGKVSYDVSIKDKQRRRSLFVVEDIKKGEQFSKENIRSVRPGFGLHPKYYNQIIGKKTKRDIKKGTPINKNLF